MHQVKDSLWPALDPGRVDGRPAGHDDIAVVRLQRDPTRRRGDPPAHPEGAGGGAEGQGGGGGGGGGARHHRPFHRQAGGGEAEARAPPQRRGRDGGAAQRDVHGNEEAVNLGLTGIVSLVV